MAFSGSIPALITPFRHDAVDLDAVAQLVRWHVESGSNALVVAGSTGENWALSDAEYQVLVHTAVQAAQGRVPIIAGISANHTHRAVLLAERAVDAGASALLHATGFYNKPSPSQIVAHYQAFCAATTLPVLLYNVPSRTGVRLSVETVAALAQLENVVGIKDATGDMAQLSAERSRIHKPFAFLSGDDGSALGYLAHGGTGCISVTANLLPTEYAQFVAAALRGDFATARVWQDRLTPLQQALFQEPNPCGIKAALAHLGRCGEDLRLPMLPATSATRQQIQQTMALLGV